MGQNRSRPAYHTSRLIVASAHFPVKYSKVELEKMASQSVNPLDGPIRRTFKSLGKSVDELLIAPWEAINFAETISHNADQPRRGPQ